MVYRQEDVIDCCHIRLADGREAAIVRKHQGLPLPNSTSAAELNGQFERWPDVQDGCLVIVQESHGWLVSVAPALPVDVLVSVSDEGTVELAATVAALTKSIRAPSLDETALADRFNGWVRLDGSRAVLRGVHRVVGGTELRIVGGVLHWRKWWEPSKIAIVRNASSKQLATRLRTIAEEVVSRHLPFAGPVAVQLSGGRDSSLLCALAAKQLAAGGRQVHAMTALPCAASAPANDAHQFDESAGAAATASLFGNVIHHQLRPRPGRLATFLDRLHHQLGEPIQQPVSLSWLVPQLERCVELGIRVLLTGDNGNFSVSAGGIPNLSDVAREEGIWPWLQTSRRLFSEGVSLREIARVSFGARLPLELYKIGRKRGQPDPLFNDYPFFKGNLRATLLEMTPSSGDPRPSASDRDVVRQVADSLCSLIPVGRVDYGVELVACWSDRALFELMLSVPSSTLASASDRRILFDEAFGDLLPPEILRPVRRGRQNVDFHAAIDRDDLLKGIDRYHRSSLCKQMVDLEKLATSAAAWPTARNLDIRHYGFWVGQFLAALSLASFLYTREYPNTDASGLDARPLHAAS